MIMGNCFRASTPPVLHSPRNVVKVDFSRPGRRYILEEYDSQQSRVFSLRPTTDDIVAWGGGNGSVITGCRFRRSSEERQWSVSPTPFLDQWQNALPGYAEVAVDSQGATYTYQWSISSTGVVGPALSVDAGLAVLPFAKASRFDNIISQVARRVNGNDDIYAFNSGSKVWSVSASTPGSTPYSVVDTSPTQSGKIWAVVIPNYIQLYGSGGRETNTVIPFSATNNSYRIESLPNGSCLVVANAGISSQAAIVSSSGSITWTGRLPFGLMNSDGGDYVFIRYGSNTDQVGFTIDQYQYSPTPTKLTKVNNFTMPAIFRSGFWASNGIGWIGCSRA